MDGAFFVVNIPASKEHVYDLSTFLSCFSEEQAIVCPTDIKTSNRQATKSHLSMAAAFQLQTFQRSPIDRSPPTVALRNPPCLPKKLDFRESGLW